MGPRKRELVFERSLARMLLLLLPTGPPAAAAYLWPSSVARQLVSPFGAAAACFVSAAYAPRPWVVLVVSGSIT